MGNYDSWKTTEPDPGYEPENEPTEEEEHDAWLDALMQEIKTKQDEVAPRIFSWVATLRDYDLDDPIGRGATEIEAIQDLIEQLGDPR